ncbi:Pleiotropic drug resistance protein 3 [Morus notabilis]|uniref:Pleiotropic drug resistance protein 3 n=1 Tax=Morus notabilis TaxID=981085 RepID=W9R131_9ROSA|nr:Pleiotropic drug resistance protein 3 [Morus notabilis]
MYALEAALTFFSSKGNENCAVRINENGKRVVDVTKLGAQERHIFIERLIKCIESDNLRAGVKLPTVEVRYKNLHVEAECQVVNGKPPLPTLWNALKNMLSYLGKLLVSKAHGTKISIITDASGIIKPGRMTLLLGPPGSGKTSLLKALSGNLINKSLQVRGEVSYNGYKLGEFVPQKTSAYISQHDLHIPETTVRETLDFAARKSSWYVSKIEKEAGLIPDPDVDAYMKAISVEGLKRNLETDYILRILGIDICSDTLVGDAMTRGISGGQKKRLTTGEMMLVHITDATALVSLLQPAPEVFSLFDDLILMSEGKVVYHGPCDQVLDFFEDCEFRCPERKDIAEFLLEVGAFETSCFVFEKLSS